MAKQYALRLMFDTDALDFYDIGLAEVVLLRRSKFVGQRLIESGIRRRFGINVLAIRRGEEYIKRGVARHETP